MALNNFKGDLEAQEIRMLARNMVTSRSKNYVGILDVSVNMVDDITEKKTKHKRYKRSHDLH